MEADEAQGAKILDVLLTLAESQADRDRFAEDPEAYLKAAGLSDTKVNALRQRNLEEIRKLVEPEVSEAVAPDLRWYFIFICPF